MCFKKIKVNWKEVMKVAPIMGIIALIGAILLEDTTTLLGSIVVTAFILNRRLGKKEDWGLLLGFIVNLVVFAIAFLLFDLVSIYFGW